VVKSVSLARPEGTRKELEFALPPLNGQYEIVMTATGAGVPNGSVVKPFERTVYEWEHNQLGKSTKVYPPFTPIKVAGYHVQTVLRDHEMKPLRPVAVGGRRWQRASRRADDLSRDGKRQGRHRCGRARVHQEGG